MLPDRLADLKRKSGATARKRQPERSDVTQGQFVAEDVAAGNRLVLGLGAGTFATDLAFNCFSPRPYGLRDGHAQIEVAPETFAARTGKGKQGLCVSDVYLVSQRAVFSETVGFEIGEVNGQRFEFGKFCSEADGVVCPLDLLQAVFRFGTRASWHHVQAFGIQPHERGHSKVPGKVWSNPPRSYSAAHSVYKHQRRQLRKRNPKPEIRRKFEI